MATTMDGVLDRVTITAYKSSISTRGEILLLKVVSCFDECISRYVVSVH
jgi:hypothetical protein